MTFRPEQLLPRTVVAQITEARVRDPRRVARAAAHRKRRPSLTRDGRLQLLAADHPARGVLAIPGAPQGMGDRGAFLGRIARALQAPSLDGVMATMDIIEDLLILDDLLREAGGAPLLDDRVVIASLNRGGIQGARWELDDPMTGPGARACKRLRIDGGKILLRIHLDEPASLETLKASARMITRLTRAGLPTFLEPLAVERRGEVWATVKEASAIVRVVSIAQALGESSRLIWLKLPYCDDFERVARATTLPIVILGGAATGEPSAFLQHVEAAMAAGPNVRGTLAGRNVLFPGDADPLVIAEMMGLIVRGATVADAEASGRSRAGRDLDAIARWLG